MKITFTQHRSLAGGKTVNPGDTLESPKDGPDELLQAYVINGIALEAVEAGKRESDKPLQPISASPAEPETASPLQPISASTLKGGA
ncbi:MAG: hypothetical protein A2Y38_26335 [Spirochaetes bacterium GWB1_59_5]|nr:MAG: hypothetical protein A2Y38_26335 [Spirochaetes bacterium GWB1_59_5]